MTPPLRVRVAIALLFVGACAASAVVLTRTRRATGGEPENDSITVAGISPADLTKVPAAKRTLIVGQITARAAYILTPAPTPDRAETNDVLPPLAIAPPLPVFSPTISVGVSPGFAGSGAQYTKRNGWAGYIEGKIVSVFVGAKNVRYGDPSGAVSAVYETKSELNGTYLGGQFLVAPKDVGPLHVTAFDANDVLTLQNDDGSATLLRRRDRRVHRVTGGRPAAAGGATTAYRDTGTRRGRRAPARGRVAVARQPRRGARVRAGRGACRLRGVPCAPPVGRFRVQVYRG
jgi:hypothetical protein